MKHRGCFCLRFTCGFRWAGSERLSLVKEIIEILSHTHYVLTSLKTKGVVVPPENPGAGEVPWFLEITSGELAIFKNRQQDVRKGCRWGHSGQEHVKIESSRKSTWIGALQTYEKVRLLQVEDLSAAASLVPFHWSKNWLWDEPSFSGFWKSHVHEF